MPRGSAVSSEHGRAPAYPLREGVETLTPRKQGPRVSSGPCSSSLAATPATSATVGLGPSSPLGLVASFSKEGPSLAAPPHGHRFPPAESLLAVRTCPNVGDTVQCKPDRVCPCALPIQRLVFFPLPLTLRRLAALRRRD